MAAASVAEQASAGLPGAAAGIQARLAEGNAAYRARFGFPFIIAVRGRTPDEIVTVLEARVGNDRATELATALDQVCAIARLRVGQLVAS
jgi:2-oxo-4-hydroxy-4-carboxy-5-ureidoimidazoline decarboxylase